MLLIYNIKISASTKIHEISTDFDIRSFCFHSNMNSFFRESRYFCVIFSVVCPSSFWVNSFPRSFSYMRPARLRISWNVGGLSLNVIPDFFRALTKPLVRPSGCKTPLGLFVLMPALSRKSVVLAFRQRSITAPNCRPMHFSSRSRGREIMAPVLPCSACWRPSTTWSNRICVKSSRRWPVTNARSIAKLNHAGIADAASLVGRYCANSSRSRFTTTFAARAGVTGLFFNSSTGPWEGMEPHLNLAGLGLVPEVLAPQALMAVDLGVVVVMPVKHHLGRLTVTPVRQVS
ncbi:hypothetical protein SOD_c17790 [Serratia plymuthica 4Rx13]|nr:hypothetical protein SOD_c17790 [Serratia plymuthica 4Rx13]